MLALEHRYESEGHADRFQELKRYLTGSEPHIAYQEVAETLGMTEANVRVTIHRLRKRCGEALRSEIVETVDDPGELDDELRHLLTVVEPG